MTELAERRAEAEDVARRRADAAEAILAEEVAKWEAALDAAYKRQQECEDEAWRQREVYQEEMARLHVAKESLRLVEDELTVGIELKVREAVDAARERAVEETCETIGSRTLDRARARERKARMKPKWSSRRSLRFSLLWRTPPC